MKKQKVFDRTNIDEHLNTDRDYYFACGTRRVGMHTVSFVYMNTLASGERLTIDIDGEESYKHTVKDIAFMFNGIDNALVIVNEFVQDMFGY